MPSIEVTVEVEKASGRMKSQMHRCSALHAAIISILRATIARQMGMAKRFDIAIDQDKAQFMPKMGQRHAQEIPPGSVLINIDTYYSESFIRA